MRPFILASLSLIAIGLSGCESEADRQADVTEDRMEQQAEDSAVAAGDAVVAVGLTERQLIDADLVSADGTELGSIEGVLRGANGQVDRLLVEIEDSNPDRFVELPITGLRAVARGDDTDLTGDLTKAQLTALPDVSPPVR